MGFIEELKMEEVSVEKPSDLEDENEEEDECTKIKNKLLEKIRTKCGARTLIESPWSRVYNLITDKDGDAIDSREIWLFDLFLDYFDKKSMNKKIYIMPDADDIETLTLHFIGEDGIEYIYSEESAEE